MKGRAFFVLIVDRTSWRVKASGFVICWQLYYHGVKGFMSMGLIGFNGGHLGLENRCEHWMKCSHKDMNETNINI